MMEFDRSRGRLRSNNFAGRLVTARIRSLLFECGHSFRRFMLRMGQ
jgi:hypothetical protein